MQKTELKKNIALLCIVLLLTFGVVEVSLRFFWEKPGYGYPSGLHIPDEKRGYKYQPNFRGTFPSQEFSDVEIKINSKGLRDDEHNFSRRDGVTRILALGDSAAFGAGVPFNDTYLKQLENLFKKNSYAVEIIKAGVNGYEFQQEFSYYQEEGYAYKPDIILVNIALNDAGEVNVQDIRESRFGKGVFSYQNIKEIVRNYCFTCNLIYFNSVILQSRLQDRGADFNEQYFNWVYHLWEGESWEFTKNQMSEFIKEARENNAEVVFFIVPYNQQFSNSSQNWDDRPQQTLKEFGKEQNILVIDPLFALDVPDYESLYLYNDNVHWNKKGSEIASVVLFENLKGIVNEQ
jgi:hypothetical protein